MAKPHSEADFSKPTENLAPKTYAYGRREFMRRVLLGGTAAAVAATVPWPAAAQDVPIGDLTVNVIPHPSPEQVENVAEVFSQSYGDIKVYFDGNWIPLRYVRDDSEYRFTETERSNLRLAKEQSLKSSESEVGYQEALAIDERMTSPSVEHPYVTEAPTDRLDDETLETLGVTIHNDRQNNRPQLFLRQSAIENGGILEPLKLLNEQHAANENTPTSDVDIVLLNGPWTVEEYMPVGEEFDPFRGYLEMASDTVSKILKIRSSIHEEELAGYRAIIDDTHQSELAREDAHNELLKEKIEQEFYVHTIGPEMLIDEIAAIKGSIGSFIAGSQIDAGSAHPTSLVYLANPTVEQVRSHQIVTFYYDQNGTFRVDF
jgi:hypothetical protein